ncbi:MAG: c-type cytochrome [Gemmatimonadaceae bacterium]
MTIRRIFVRRFSHVTRLATGLSCAFTIALSISACSGAPEKIAAGGSGPVGLPPDSLMQLVALGDIAGGHPNTLTVQIKNPYEGSIAAADAGRQQFIDMNCAACHGYDGRGGMGPNLTDTYWRYGGSPASIYNSIYQGRPDGMPAWGRMIPRDDIWKLVTYIQSLGGSFPASLAESGRQGNLGDKDTTAGATLKGRQNDH